MSFNKHFFQNLDLGKYSKPNPYKDDIIVDPAGQYKYPGQPTRIPSNRLTMGGVPYPVWAQPNVGPGMMMYPGGEYEFPEADYVDEIPMAQKGIISVGPQYDSRYGTMGNLGYETQFRGQRDRSTIHNLRGDVYGGDFGFGVAGTHKFGTERRDVPVMGFAENRLGYDTLRGAHLDFKGGADIHLLKDRYRGNLDVTPFGGVWGQTKAREESIDPNNFGSNVGLTYGVRANYGKDLGGGRFNVFGGLEASPSLGKLTGEEQMASETLQFAPQWNVGMSYGLPVNKTVRKIKDLAKAKQKDKEIQEATKPRLAAVNRSTPSFQGGGSSLDQDQNYNSKRAMELGYTPDSTGHMPSVDEETGMWLKSKDHPTAWKEYLYGSLNKDLGTNYNVVVNPEGHFGENQLQYVPKKYQTQGEVDQGPTQQEIWDATVKFFYDNPQEGAKMEKLYNPQEAEGKRRDVSQNVYPFMTKKGAINVPGVTTLQPDQFIQVEMPSDYIGLPVYQTVDTHKYLTVDPDFNKAMMTRWAMPKIGKDEYFFGPNRWLQPQLKKGGGLDRSKDYGSEKKPYPKVKSSDFAGGGRSYPIPTKADAVDALRLAGLHGRADVRAKVYKKYPDLKKQEGGEFIDIEIEEGDLQMLLDGGFKVEDI